SAMTTCRSLLFALFVGVIAACAVDAGRAPSDTLPQRLIGLFPSMKEILDEARSSEVKPYEEQGARQLVVTSALAATSASRALKPGRRSRALATSIEAVVRSDACESYAIRENGLTILQVRRAGAKESKATVQGGAVVYEEAFPGTDAIVFARSHGIEE